MKRLSYVIAKRINRVLVDPQGGDDVPVFWPALDLHWIDGLDDMTPVYDAELLSLAANSIEAGKPLHEEMAIAVAGALRELADPMRRAGITSQPVRALNLAVHYHVAKETHRKAAAALAHVAVAWDMPQATILDLIATRRDDAGGVLEGIVSERMASGGFKTRADVLAAIDADMFKRASDKVITRPAPRKHKRRHASRKK